MTKDEIEEIAIKHFDGYGTYFPPEVQLRHLENILHFLYLPHIEEKKGYTQVPWRDKPAGAYEKGSGV